MIRTVMFDVDDTLYSFQHANYIASEKLVEYTREQFGWEKDEFFTRQSTSMAEVKRYTGTSGGFRARILRYQNMLEAASLPIYPHAHIMSDLYRETLLNNMIPEPGAEEFLRFLKFRGVRIGIASDATALQQISKLERLGFLSYVDFMVTSEEAGVEKPDQKFFARCNEKSFCDPHEVMFIGDNPDKDYSGAAVASYQAVWYNPNNKPAEHPMQEIRNFSEAAALFERLNSTVKSEADEK